MKEATSRNITNLQQVLNVQQSYTTTLCTHINAILVDPDIDGPEMQWAHNTAVVSVHDLFNSPEPDQVDASNTQEESIDQDQHNTTHSNPEDTYRPHNPSPQQIPNQPPQASSTGQQQSQLILQDSSDEFSN